MVEMNTDREIVKWLRRLVRAAILGPLVIHVAYNIPIWFPQLPDALIWVSKWEPADVLGYFGTILSAIVTVIILRITILNERVQKAKENLPKQIQDAETIVLHNCDCVEALINICIAGKGCSSMSSAEINQFNAACDCLVTRECAHRIAALSTNGLDVIELNQLFVQVNGMSMKTLSILSDNICSSTFSVNINEFEQMKVELSLLKKSLKTCFSKMRISSI